MQEKRNASDGIDLAAKRAQAVEHGLAMLECDLEAFGARRLAGHAAPDLERCLHGVVLAADGALRLSSIWPARQRDELIDAPVAVETRMILALMRAAALGAGQRRQGDGLRHQQHVAQVEPVDQYGIERRCGRKRNLADLGFQPFDGL